MQPVSVNGPGTGILAGAVVISGLTLWNSYQERSSAEAEKAAEKQAKSREAQTLILSASVDGQNLRLAARDPEQAIQGQTIAFPSALGVDAVDTVDPRIEARWIERAANKLPKKGRSGDARLPVAITTRFVSGGESYTDTAIYDVGYRVDEGLLDSDVELLGLSLVERGTAKSAQPKLDALWKRRNG